MAGATNDTKLTILSDHYKDTCQTVDRLVKTRDRAFLLILVLLGVMAFQFVSPEQSESVLTQVVEKQLGIDAAPSITLIGSLVWFGLLAVTIRYYQTTVNLEKRYDYLHKLEADLSPHYSSGIPFTRESKSYLQDYPLFLKWLHLVYRVVFPALLVVAASARLWSEWHATNPPALPLTLDTVIWCVLVISTGLYLLNVHFKR